MITVCKVPNIPRNRGSKMSRSFFNFLTLVENQSITFHWATFTYAELLATYDLSFFHIHNCIYAYTGWAKFWEKVRSLSYWAAERTGQPLIQTVGTVPRGSQKMVVNLTDWTLLSAQEDTSKLGLNFASAPSKLSLTDTKELLCHLKRVRLTSSPLWSRKMGISTHY